MPISVQPFGKMPDGTVIERISLRGGGLQANVLTYGGVLQDLRLEGHGPALVLGFEQFDYYLNHSPYFGAIVGRCANRIRDGHMLLGSVEFQLDQNETAGHHLHGGKGGTGNRIWTIDKVEDDNVVLSLLLADGEMGYPGNMQISLIYHLLPENVLDIKLEAISDKTTLCNLAHHSYFNLDGSDTILDHLLRVDSDGFNPVDDELIPTGEVRSVEATPFDFRQLKSIGAVSRQQLIDHNFCLSQQRQKLRPVAQLESPKSAIRLEVHTSEPGLQVYDGKKIDIPVNGLDGRHMGAYAGIALEAQVWPDAVHHQHFPQAVVDPGETYRQYTQYAFSKV